MTRNVAASVRARLAASAKATNRPFQEVLQHYGLERFLYRLAATPHRAQFLLKGALLLNVWGAPQARPTRDIDLLGYVENEIAVIEVIVRAVCGIAVEDDGLRFDPATVTGQRITVLPPRNETTPRCSISRPRGSACTRVRPSLPRSSRQWFNLAG